MLNFFRRIQPHAPVLRNNYFIQVDDNLAWSESIGSEDSDGIGWFTAVSSDPVSPIVMSANDNLPLYRKRTKQSRTTISGVRGKA